MCVCYFLVNATLCFTELANTMKYGVLYNIVFTKSPLKSVSGDVTAFHRIDHADIYSIYLCKLAENVGL